MDSNAEQPPTLAEMMERDAGLGVPDISDRDRAGIILGDLNYEEHLSAISALLARNDKADKSINAQMMELDEEARTSAGRRNEQALDAFGVAFYDSIYQSAAHSMAALGMLAPLIESMFYQAFQGIRLQYYGANIIPPGHIRSGLVAASKFWDCHFVCNAKRNGKCQKALVQGIFELADVVELTAHLPPGLRVMLEALFLYRNKMFHNGFEWPEAERRAFAENAKKWPGWFRNSLHGGEPWIFYMSDEFMTHCLQMIDKLLDSFGAYCRRKRDMDAIPVE